MCSGHVLALLLAAQREGGSAVQTARGVAYAVPLPVAGEPAAGEEEEEVVVDELDDVPPLHETAAAQVRAACDALLQAPCCAAG